MRIASAGPCVSATSQPPSADSTVGKSPLQTRAVLPPRECGLTTISVSCATGPPARLLPEHLGELAGGVQLAHDVAAAHELPVDVELRDRRPGGELLHALAHVLVLEHV